MLNPHVQHTGTLFDSTTVTGRVLIAGGAATAGGAGTTPAEIYDGTKFACPGSIDTGANCTANQPMLTARAQHAAVLLPNGQVALFGGLDGASLATGAIETFDPAFDNGPLKVKGKFTTNGATLATARRALTATSIGNPESILVVGGFTAGTTPTNAIQLFDVNLNVLSNVTPIDTLITARGAHAATAISSTTVLIVGGTISTAPGETFFTQ
jgi:hypothetical protein